MKVYQSINKVMADISQIGIAKNNHNSQGNGYKFRGIDDVYNALAPLMAKHGLLMIPRVLARNVVERQSKAGSALFYTVLDIEYDFICSEDGSKHTARVFGEAMDSGDKSTNKAMSAAFKYAALQTFCIPTEGDNDSDHTTHEVKAAPAKKIGKGVISATGGAMDAIDSETKMYLEEFAAEITGMVNVGHTAEANEYIKAENFEVDQKVALWSLLNSSVRSALKKESAVI